MDWFPYDRDIRHERVNAGMDDWLLLCGKINKKQWKLERVISFKTGSK